VARYDALLAERLHRQLLSGEPAHTVVEVVQRILAVQAQDPRGARLAIRSRSVALHTSDVDRALDAKQVLISTLNRGTLHLVTPEDYWLLHPLTTPQLETGTWRRLGQEQVSPDAAERGVEVIRTSLADGPLTRNQLRERIALAGVRTEGQAFVHIAMLATIRGLLIRGPTQDGEHAFVLVRDWLGKPPKSLSRGQALGELARRYLTGHGPATDRDLAKWAGITLGDARLGLGQLTLVDRGHGLIALDEAPTSPCELPPPRLLGTFEPSLLGWESRESIITTHVGLVTNNGIFRTFAMVDGQAVGTWSLTKDKLTLTLFGEVSAKARKALDTDAERVVRFLRAS
jgi:hypothetical protein